jgi:hypothetical protein
MGEHHLKKRNRLLRNKTYCGAKDFQAGHGLAGSVGFIGLALNLYQT